MLRESTGIHLCYELCGTQSLSGFNAPTDYSTEQDTQITRKVDEHPTTKDGDYEHEVVVENEEWNRSDDAEELKRACRENCREDQNRTKDSLCTKATDQDCG